MKYNEKLKNVIEKKIKTIMIGAVYAIEQEFGLEWDKANREYVKTNNQHNISNELVEAIQQIRDDILDLGNDQLRALKNEIDEYFDVKPRIYHTEFRVIQD